MKTLIINGKSYQQIGGKQGSNEGGFFKDKDGLEYYIKWLPAKFTDQKKFGMAKNGSYTHYEGRNRNRMVAEALAAKLYGLFGVEATKADFIEFESDGKKYVGVMTRKVNIAELNTLPSFNLPAFNQIAQEDFLVDALLGNYDVVGWGKNNLCYFTDSPSLIPFRLDPGGALFYSATGKAKKQKFSTEVHEFEVLQTGQNNSSTVFHVGPLGDARDVFSGASDSPSLAVGMRKLLSVSDEDLALCINKNGFGDKRDKDGLTKNEKLISLLINRKRDLIARAQAKIFDQIVRTYLHAQPLKDEKEDVSLSLGGADTFRQKHGGMHASRTALYTEQFIEMLQKAGYEPALHLSEKDFFLIKVAAMFHDAGRGSDTGDDNPEWEKRGADLCAEWLTKAGFSQVDIEKVNSAMVGKDDTEVQQSNVYALILAAADSLDWVRSHGSDFSVQYMPSIIKQYINEADILSLATTAKQLATEQGDSYRPQLGIKANFNIAIKKNYEHSPFGCFSATRQRALTLNSKWRTVLNSKSGGGSEGPREVKEYEDALAPVIPPHHLPHGVTLGLGGPAPDPNAERNHSYFFQSPINPDYSGRVVGAAALSIGTSLCAAGTLAFLAAQHIALGAFLMTIGQAVLAGLIAVGLSVTLAPVGAAVIAGVGAGLAAYGLYKLCSRPATEEGLYVEHMNRLSLGNSA